MNIAAVRTRLFREREDFATFVVEHLPALAEGSIVAVASKVVALAEGRVIEHLGAKEKDALIRRESEWARKVLPKWWLTVRDGSVVVNAGIDESNADGKIILLPQDSFASAAALRKKLMKRFSVVKCGVVITDSRITPLRAGVVGIALGYAGFCGIRDYRGTKDLFGRRMDVTQTDVADSLATAATLAMGEGAERCPLALITDAPVVFVDSVRRAELQMDPRRDMYRSMFRGSRKTARRKK